MFVWQEIKTSITGIKITWNLAQLIVGIKTEHQGENEYLLEGLMTITYKVGQPFLKKIFMS